MLQSKGKGYKIKKVYKIKLYSTDIQSVKKHITNFERRESKT